MRKSITIILVAAFLQVWFACVAQAAPTVTAVAPDPSTLTTTPLSTNFVVSFSEIVDPATITGTATTIYLTPATPATVTYNSVTNQATLSPTTALLPGIDNPNPGKRVPGTAYTLTVNGVRNLSGVPVTTASFNYPVTPSLTLDPYDGQTGIGTVRYKISVAFTEAMDPTTINGTTFTVSANGVAATGTVSPATAYGDYTPNKYVFLPAVPLTAGTEYTATLATGIHTLANGKPLSTSVTWKFTTAPPLATVTATSPGADAIDVATTTTVQAFFSIAMNASTLNTSTFALSVKDTGAPVSGAVTYNSTTNSATFAPASLAEGTAYTAAISAQVQDSLGRNLGAPYSWTFTTVYPAVKLLPSGLFFDLLQNAYNTSNPGDTITLLARVYAFKEKLDFNKQVSVLLRGGYDSGFATQTGYATLNGDLTLTSGVLTVDRLIVAP